LYFLRRLSPLCSFFFMAPAPTAIYPLSLHDALPISLLGWGCAVKWSGAYWVAGFALLVLLFDLGARRAAGVRRPWAGTVRRDLRSEEHTSELQSRENLVCRLLLEKKKTTKDTENEAQ